jgi:hypothetical protein
MLRDVGRMLRSNPKGSSARDPMARELKAAFGSSNQLITSSEEAF